MKLKRIDAFITNIDGSELYTIFIPFGFEGRWIKIKEDALSYLKVNPATEDEEDILNVTLNIALNELKKIKGR